MAAASISEEMLQDANFRTLASSKNKVEDFTTMIEEHVGGWTQKKRLVDGLKDLSAKVDAMENKLSVIKAVGKAKKLEPEEQSLVDNHSAANLKEKVKILNDAIAAMLEAGKVTGDEKPVVLSSLNERKTAAKAANKEKLVEKLEKQISGVVKATSIDPPVANLKELDGLTRKLTDIEAIERRPAKSHTAADKERMEAKPQVQEDIKALEARSRMWFESEFEFKPRLAKALEKLAITEAEQRKKEEQEAWERKLREEEEEIERKKKEAQEKLEQQEKKMMEKLEQKRLEAAAKPQKSAPAPKAKEKKKGKRLNPLAVFSVESQADKREKDPEEEGNSQPEEDDLDDGEESTPAVTPAVTPAPSPALKPQQQPAAPASSKTSGGYPSSTAALAAAPLAAAPAAPAPKEEEKPKPKKEKVVLENKWGDAPAAPAAAAAATADEAGEEGAGEAEDDAAGPSLAAAAKAAKETVKKTPPPQPKKKEKKKFTKLSVNELGFDAKNPNYVN